MRTPITPRTAAGFRPMATKLVAASLLAAALAGCKTLEEPGAHVAGFTIIDPSQRHPIMVSQQPSSMSVRVARGSQGLTPAQQAKVAAFLERYRASDAGNSKLVISVPSGTANETAAVRAVGGMRRLINDHGFSDASIVVEPYGARDPAAPIQLSYLRFVAEGPECGRWTANLATDYRNLPHANFGCAQQHNLAAQVANPADLLGPRTATPSDQERRGVIMEKYAKGKPTGAEKGADESATVKGAN